MTYQSPGVYIEEVPSGPQPLAAAPTSVVAVIGNLRKGPLNTPTRVTAWSDFVRTFGGAHADGYTAEAVYGYFENGGPAAWVVRVDPSLSAQWTVRDANDVTSFLVEASSPGDWPGDVGITVLPDTGGGNGSLYTASVRAAATIGGGTDAAVRVDTVSGVRIGDTLTVTQADGSTAVNATVNGITPATTTADPVLTLVKAGANVNLVPGTASGCGSTQGRRASHSPPARASRRETCSSRNLPTAAGSVVSSSRSCPQASGSS